MPCKIQIRKNLKEGLEQKAGTIAHLNLEDATKEADNLNQIMGERLLYFTMNGDFMDSHFNEPSDKLIQIYYDYELKLEQEEAAKNKVDTPTVDIKPGVEELFDSNPELANIGTQEQYSQYLDTIFPDSKVAEIDNSLYISVLNQLEQENKIEKNCTGSGKLKAEKGLATAFTKGGKWKIIKDLKGYPTHKEGGVDLTIDRNGVSIKNGNTQFTAKHGLVIPKN